MFEITILLIAAHCYGDFLLQTDNIAKNKNRLQILALHVSIHGALAFLLLQQWTLWPVVLAVMLAHGAIDFIKVRYPSTPITFTVDQAAHLLSIGIIAWLAANYYPDPTLGEKVVFGNWIILGAGFTTTVWGVGHFIGTLAKQMSEQNPQLKKELGFGLVNGGATIGKLERALIFTLIAVGHPTGIGFLVAAKSILRFEEAKKQPLAEYVLIGTLWSFSLAIAITAASVYLLESGKF